MSMLRATVMLCAALLVSACLPATTKVPIGTTVGFKPDPALYGIWRGRDKDSDTPGYFSFLRNDDGSMSAVLITPPAGTDGGEWEVFALEPAVLGGHRFLNVKEVLVNGKADDSRLATEGFPLLYRVNGDKLVLYLLDDKATADAIRSGKLKGIVEPGQNGDVRITADGPSLDAFMQSPDGLALFKAPLITLRRME